MRKFLSRFLLIAAGLLLSAPLTLAVTLHVPGDYTTFGAAIAAAANGDTVLAADGVYAGDDNKNLNCEGKDLVLMSENGPDACIIDCEYSGRGFIYQNGESSAAQVIGIAVCNGIEIQGGGLYVFNADPVFKNVIINDCQALGQGGGVYIYHGNPTFLNCVLHNNFASEGGGMSGEESNVTVNSCIVAANSSTG
ncbi:MAG: hypothetical protein ABIE92_11370 [bacterium]